MTSGWVVTVKVLVEKCEEQSVAKICNIYVWNSSFLWKLYNNSDISMSPRINFQCIHCGKVFKHKQSKYRHYLNYSLKPNLDRRIYKCDDCEKDFNRKDVLDINIKKNHVIKWNLSRIEIIFVKYVERILIENLTWNVISQSIYQKFYMIVTVVEEASSDWIIMKNMIVTVVEASSNWIIMKNTTAWWTTSLRRK